MWQPNPVLNRDGSLTVSTVLHITFTTRQANTKYLHRLSAHWGHSLYPIPSSAWTSCMRAPTGVGIGVGHEAQRTGSNYSKPNCHEIALGPG